MSIIKSVLARQILDSRGNPTIEVDLVTDNDVMGRAAVPSGASTGKYEAVELRDNDTNKYMGRGVTQAVNNVNTVLAEALKGKSVKDQAAIDQIMIDLDGTDNKSNLGANAILGISLAAAKAAAKEQSQSLWQYVSKDEEVSLPVPMMNILNGGAHADNKIEFQEFMIIPTGANRFSEALRMGVEVFHHLKQVLKKKGYSINVGDEGGFAPEISSNEEAIETVLQAIKAAGYEAGQDICIAMDAAASEFYDNKNEVYDFKKSDKQKRSSSEMISYWADWIKEYPIVSIEDGLDEDDWKGWAELTKSLGDRVQLVGDDIFVTNPTRLQRGIDEQVSNSILIKVNQIGTLTETIEAISLAKSNNMATVMSHRSGETEDTTIADLAVGLNLGQIKTGSASRSDRIAKYNQLLRIEEELGERAVYNGTLFVEK